MNNRRTFGGTRYAKGGQAIMPAQQVNRAGTAVRQTNMNPPASLAKANRQIEKLQNRLENRGAKIKDLRGQVRQSAMSQQPPAVAAPPDQPSAFQRVLGNQFANQSMGYNDSGAMNQQYGAMRGLASGLSGIGNSLGVMNGYDTMSDYGDMSNYGDMSGYENMSGYGNDFQQMNQSYNPYGGVPGADTIQNTFNLAAQNQAVLDQSRQNQIRQFGVAQGDPNYMQKMNEWYARETGGMAPPKSLVRDWERNNDFYTMGGMGSAEYQNKWMNKSKGDKTKQTARQNKASSIGKTRSVGTSTAQQSKRGEPKVATNSNAKPAPAVRGRGAGGSSVPSTRKVTPPPAKRTETASTKRMSSAGKRKNMKGGGLARKGVGMALAKGGMVRGSGCAVRGNTRGRMK